MLYFFATLSTKKYIFVKDYLSLVNHFIMKILAPIILFLFTFNINAQLPYTQPVFNYDSIINIEYGVAVNYVGKNDTLLLDIYKPIGDNNCLRPVMILAHGGAWVVESKENSSMQYMARELAKRGWVVANINYRLGTHKASNYSSNLLCNSLGIEACAYVADSAEVERANYRAMQDAKGAIRFMKSRNQIDSTDINNVFMAGESAGAFISFSTAFTNDISKKPMSCYAIGNVSSPHSDLASLGCYDASSDFSRPDLGDIEGTLNLGSYDASLKGVGSFFGGVFDINLLENLNTSQTSLYLYAQGSDVIVNYDYGPLFERLSSECFSFLGCTEYEDYPNAYGGEGIRNYLETSLVDTSLFYNDIIYNFSGNDCQANGHAIDNPQLRLQNMINFFSKKIANSGNNPNSNCATIDINPNSNGDSNISVINPFKDFIEIQLTINEINTEYILTNMLGKVVAKGQLNTGKNTINTAKFVNGVYLLNIITSEKIISSIKLVKSN